MIDKQPNDQIKTIYIESRIEVVNPTFLPFLCNAIAFNYVPFYEFLLLIKLGHMS